MCYYIIIDEPEEPIMFIVSLPITTGDGVTVRECLK